MQWLKKYRIARNLTIYTLLSIIWNKCLERYKRTRFQAYTLIQRIAYFSKIEGKIHSEETFELFLKRKFSLGHDFILTDYQKQEVVDLIKKRYFKWMDDSVNIAECICGNKISILGMNQELGDTINWHKDYISGYEWENKYFTKVKRIEYSDDSDIKYPWELSRFHLGVYLGKAYVLTGDEKYAQKFFLTYRNWVESNPIYMGVNWSCTMEVSIRVVNLIWTMFFLKGSRCFDDDMKKLFVKSIYDHGKYIYNNLEINPQIIDGRLRKANGNHYIADLVGLLYIALTFPEFKESKEWFHKAYNELLSEIRLQVGADGVHYEYSLNYHRLVLEMVLSALAYLKRANVEIPDDVKEKVEKMVEFVRSYVLPDGSIPPIRDIDNGRFHILGEDNLTDHRHILCIGAIYFGRDDFAVDEICEDAIWFFGVDGLKIYESFKMQNRSIMSKGFEESGFYILRNANSHMFVNCSGIGRKGFGGHTHNDFLGFDLFAYDTSFLTDSGSYVYSRFPDWRHKFRSVYAHNVVVVDKHEMNKISESDIFRIGNEVKPKVNYWAPGDNFDLLDSEYTLKMEDQTNITHNRRYLFDKNRNCFIVKDVVNGNGERTIETLFHFSETIKVSIENGSCLRGDAKSGASLLIIPMTDKQLRLRVDSGWISRLYGVKTMRQVGIYEYTGPVPVEFNYLLCPISALQRNDDHVFTRKMSKDIYSDEMVSDFLKT